MNANQIEQIVKSLQLEPHPEGGFYAETYRSKHVITENALPEEFFGDRNVSTGIYYLLRSGDFSKFHRIKSDELWHHYEGCRLSIHVIHPDGTYDRLKLGKDVANGYAYQHCVPAGAWFAATVDDEESFVLCGCTVAPGFDFSDFELADAAVLIRQFPKHKELIQKLT